MNTKDTIYQSRMEVIPPFEFNQGVADVFDDMAIRSIPNYSELQQIISEIVQVRYTSVGTIYDLGCSTGNTIYNILKKLHSTDVKIIGIDSSQAMCNKCRENLKQYSLPGQVQIQRQDIRTNAVIILMSG